MAPITGVSEEDFKKILAYLKYIAKHKICLLYTSDAADERSSVDLGGRRIINKKTDNEYGRGQSYCWNVADRQRI